MSKLPRINLTMNRITIDMSPVVHGSRAIKRCTVCMAKELIKHEDVNFNLLYIDYKNQVMKYLNPLTTHVKESVIRVPYRLLIPLWKKFAWPSFDSHLSECDLFYTNEFYFPPTKKTIILATIHGLAYKMIPEKLPSHVASSLDQGLSFILKHADYLVAVSETTKKELIHYAGVDSERIYVVTHGVDRQFQHHTDQQDVWARLRKFYRLDHPYILYVGAIGIHKNITGILSAYEIFCGDSPHHLVLAGPPDSAWDSVKRFVSEKNLSGRVHLLGHVDKTERLVDLYNGASLFVFPSFYEGWTSPPLEAMACGTPVITSNYSSLPETVEDAAIQIDPENIEELASEIENILSDQTLTNDLVKKGLAHAASHTWEKAAEKLVAVFTEIQSRGHWKK